MPRNDGVMVSGRGSVLLSGIPYISVCVAEIISTYKLAGLHVARLLCGFQAGDVHSDRKNNLYCVWIAIAQNSDRHSGLECRLANSSVPSSEH